MYIQNIAVQKCAECQINDTLLIEHEGDNLKNSHSPTL